MNEQVMEMIAGAARLESTELDLSGQGLTELPEEIGSLINLQSLYLPDNRLSNLSNLIKDILNSAIASKFRSIWIKDTLIFLGNQILQITPHLITVGKMPPLVRMLLKTSTAHAISE
jgi:hypothetical protein